jgi:multisubunit Na+/H+ antiporter MnhC subunit
VRVARMVVDKGFTRVRLLYGGIETSIAAGHEVTSDNATKCRMNWRERNMHALSELTKQYAPLIGRIMIAIVFLLSVWAKLTGFDATIGAMAGRSMPIPQVLIVLAIVIEFAGSMLLIIGWQPRCAALALYLRAKESMRRNEQRLHRAQRIGSFVRAVIGVVVIGPASFVTDLLRGGRQIGLECLPEATDPTAVREPAIRRVKKLKQQLPIAAKLNEFSQQERNGGITSNAHGTVITARAPSAAKN